MKKRFFGLTVWIALACLLYFFENNTGTRTVLACSLLLPLVPAIRRGLLGEDAFKTQPREAPQTVKAFSLRQEDDIGDMRAYQPGDPVNRIHWKLSAKRAVLLVREQRQDKAAETEEQKRTAADSAVPLLKRPKLLFLIGFSALLFALLTLLLFPPACQGMKALLNRLYDASEAANAYVYDRFPVSADQPVWPALFLLILMALSLLGMTVLSGSRLLALCLLGSCALFQVYFGLAFPGWFNLLLFTLSAVWMLRRPWEKRTLLSLLIGIGAVSLAVILIWPGVHAATEAASEAARDRLSQAAQFLTGAKQELSASPMEAHHARTASLVLGHQEAQPDREYQWTTVAEEQISKPRWVSLLRTALLLLLTVALVILPFFPFWLLNRRRKKAQDARKIFQSENISEAIAAIFQRVISLLEATGNGAGNLPYAQWSAEIAPDYANHFTQCEKLFEEAVYSAHEMREAQRQQALDLLAETERALLTQADWKQRLRLKYKEGLWE